MSGTTQDRPRARPALSLILCSRNDEYMGNSRWRLQTTLNYAADQIEALGRTDDVEILVTDWGSDVPLREVLELTTAAARMVSFILVPPQIARPLQKDSPFPEVLALNAAVRRASGAYIGRIDQDTLVGRHFLDVFLGFADGSQTIDVPDEPVMFFANVRLVPYRFAVRCPPLRMVERYIEQLGGSLQLEIDRRWPFYHSSVGIWLLPQALWRECGGYDESMLYMNAMEIEMIQRLRLKYAIVDIGRIVDFDFYHLEHYHPWVPRRSSVYRKTNRYDNRIPPETLHPNDEDWGLAQYPLSTDSISTPEGARTAPRHEWRTRDQVAYSGLLALAGTQNLLDSLRGWWLERLQLGAWRRRMKIVRETIRGAPVGTWHRLLRELWVTRREARRTLARPE